MLLFLLFFLSLYGGLNAYVYFTVVAGLGHHSWELAAALIFLVVSPIFVRVLEKKNFAVASRVLAWVSYNWMGISFLFAFLALVFELLQWMVPGFSPRLALYGNLGLTALFSIAGFIESRRIRIRRIRIWSPKLEYALEEPFRIVQISDLHLGFGSLPSHIQAILEKVESLNPQLLVSTGDLFDSDLENLQPYVDRLRSLHTPLGKIGITGNHEFYAGLDSTLAMSQEAGFQILRNSSLPVDGQLFIAGVDDPEVLGNQSSEHAEEQALSNLPPHVFTILLKHRPSVTPSLSGQFDLQLSGHTHGGQVFPFIFFTWLQYKVPHGLSKIAESSWLYVSRGTGTWGPQIRLLAPPEITVFDLTTGSETELRMLD